MIPRRHIGWTALFLSALLGAAIGLPLLAEQKTAFERKVEILHRQSDALRHELAELREDDATIKTLRQQLGDEEIGRLLTPPDRLNLARLVETTARRHQMTVTLRLTPEKILTSPPTGTPPYGSVVESQLDVQAQAATDPEIYRFTNELLQAMPGRARLLELALDKPEGKTLSLSRINARLLIGWLSFRDHETNASP